MTPEQEPGRDESKDFVRVNGKAVKDRTRMQFYRRRHNLWHDSAEGYDREKAPRVSQVH